MRVLGIDTAGPSLGCCLVDGDRVLGAWFDPEVRKGDGRLAQAVADLVRTQSIDAIGVSVGPGAFTGLRVGVALATAIAYARGIPVVPWSSLLVRASAITGEAPVLAVLDARKSRVYAGLYDVTRAVPRCVGPDADLLPDEVQIPPGAVVVGEGAPLLGVEQPEGEPAKLVALLSAHSLDRGVAPSQVSLRYCRPPDAQTSQQRRASKGLPPP